MDDYTGLAARVAAGVGGLRGCLILSRDGLVLGAHPGDDDSVAKPSWLKFATLGEPEKSFVEFADQTWVYVHRGPYAAFAVAEAGVRPGLLIDQLEQALLLAEESRTKRDGLRAPEAAAAGPRTTLHPSSGRPEPAPASARPRPVESAAAGGAPPSRPPARPAPDEAPAPAAAATETLPAAASEGPPAPADETRAGRPEPSSEEAVPPHEKPKLMTTPVTPERGDGEAGEVDRVLLAQEFSGLLQDLDPDDEGSS